MLASCHVDSGLLGSQPHVAMAPPTSKAGGEKRKNDASMAATNFA